MCTAGDATSSSISISASCDSEEGGMSPLMGAAGQGHVSIIKLLCKAGESLFTNILITMQHILLGTTKCLLTN